MSTHAAPIEAANATTVKVATARDISADSVEEKSAIVTSTNVAITIEDVAERGSANAVSTQSNVGRIVGVFVSRGGVPKLPISSGFVSRSGLEGDVQKNLKYHGGPERALCLYSREVMSLLQAEGHPIAPGAIGENILLHGLDWDSVRPGARLQLGGEVQIEISDYTRPCKKITASFRDGFFMRTWEQRFSGQSRVYARVLQEGTIRIGDVVILVTSAK